MTDRLRTSRGSRVPPHVVVMLSAATGVYAATLAGVAALQSADEAALAADRAPAAAEVAGLAAGHARLAARLDADRAAYSDAAEVLVRATTVLDAVERQLASLALDVAEIDGVSRSLPTSIRIPIPRSVVQVKAPATHATTGASGG